MTFDSFPRSPVGKPSGTLCVPTDDAERRRRHSHAPRGNEREAETAGRNTTPRRGFTLRNLMLAVALMAVALGFLAVRTAVVVDETQYVLVTEFGRVAAVYGRDGDSGLHVRWPWQSSIEVDRRLRVFDPPAREVITGDKRNLEVGSYVVW